VASFAHTFRRAFAHLRPYRGRMVVGVLCAPLSALLGVWITDLIRSTLDGLASAAGTGGEGPPPLWRPCLLMALAAFATASTRYVARRLLIDTSRRVEESLKNDLVHHLSGLPLTWFDRARTGDLISRLTQDVELVRFMLGPALLYGASALVVLPASLTIMATLSWSLTLAIAAAFVALLLASRGLMPRIHARSEDVQEAIAAISSRSLEALAGVRVLMTFGRTDAESQRLAGMSHDYLEKNVHLTRLRALYNLFIHVSRDVVVLTVLLVGGLQVLGGRLTAGELFQFLLLMGLMTWPLIAVGWILSTYPRAKAAMERVEEIFAAPLEPAGGAQPELRGAISARGLTFRYEGRQEDALSNVSFELAPGQKLGLVGPVGSGKSTLLALLVRLYDPPRGTLFVDGHDVLDLDPAVLRRTFAVAPQDPFLFSDTIAGNIRFGLEETGSGDREPAEPTGDRMSAAVWVSALAQDLPDFAEGLETVVGERGVTLSGGQKQRVSLARALAPGRPSLVLDDTLSAVDPTTERRIVERLSGARQDRTMLVATHRLSAVVDADLILVLDRGRIVQRGDHATLARRPGPYRDTWRLQREASALEAEA
jgi:ATP-binding cassette subfamily B protein